MNTHHRRWIGLTGATTLALSGFGVLGAAAAAEDRPPLPQAAQQQGASDLTYSLDGFEIGYLPPGLNRYDVSAKSSTARTGERSSQITWADGPDTVYGKVGVIRSKELRTLDDLHKAHFDHLDDASLKKVKSNKASAYLSQESGDLFWLDKPGVAVTTHLQPDKWDAKELSRFAGSVQPTNASQGSAQKPEQDPESPGKGGDVSEVSTATDTPDAAGKPEESGKPSEPRPGAKQSATPKPTESQPGTEESTAPKPQESTPPEDKPAKPESEDAQALPEGVPAEHVQICVAEQLVADGDGAASGTQGKNGKSGADAVPDRKAMAKLWRDADRDGREGATKACAKRFDLRHWQVDTVMNAMVDKADANANSSGEPAKPDKPGANSGENAAAPRPHTP